MNEKFVIHDRHKSSPHLIISIIIALCWQKLIDFKSEQAFPEYLCDTQKHIQKKNNLHAPKKWNLEVPSCLSI